MEKPVLSSDFTIDDIHKLREYNYYLTKDMTLREPWTRKPRRRLCMSLRI